MIVLMCAIEGRAHARSSAPLLVRVQCISCSPRTHVGFRAGPTGVSNGTKRVSGDCPRVEAGIAPPGSLVCALAA
eukprot:6983593-Prymnesium_polylepis.1